MTREQLIDKVIIATRDVLHITSPLGEEQNETLETISYLMASASKMMAIAIENER